MDGNTHHTALESATRPYAEGFAEYEAGFVAMCRMEEELCGFLPDAQCIDTQPHVNAEMRQTLVEWLFDVRADHRLCNATLHLAVLLVDRVLSRAPVLVRDFQLLGLVCLWVAAKYEETPEGLPTLDQVAALCLGHYAPERILRTEVEVLALLDFDVGAVRGADVFIAAQGRRTAETWAARVAAAGVADGCGARPDVDALLAQADRLLELSLSRAEFVGCAPTRVAEAAVIAAGRGMGWDFEPSPSHHCIPPMAHSLLRLALPHLPPYSAPVPVTPARSPSNSSLAAAGGLHTPPATPPSSLPGSPAAHAQGAVRAGSPAPPATPTRGRSPRPGQTPGGLPTPPSHRRARGAAPSSPRAPSPTPSGCGLPRSRSGESLGERRRKRSRSDSRETGPTVVTKRPSRVDVGRGEASLVTPVSAVAV